MKKIYKKYSIPSFLKNVTLNVHFFQNRTTENSAEDRKETKLIKYKHPKMLFKLFSGD